MKKAQTILHEPTEAEIQHQAYLLWLEGGCREGRELEDWQAAKELIRHHNGHSAPRKKRSTPAPAALAAH